MVTDSVINSANASIHQQSQGLVGAHANLRAVCPRGIKADKSVKAEGSAIRPSPRTSGPGQLTPSSPHSLSHPPIPPGRVDPGRQTAAGCRWGGSDLVVLVMVVATAVGVTRWVWPAQEGQGLHAHQLRLVRLSQHLQFLSLSQDEEKAPHRVACADARTRSRSHTKKYTGCML